MSETTSAETVSVKKIKKIDLIRCFLLWEVTAESCLSYERLMSLGFAHSMVPIINRLYTTKEEKRAALKRHMSFFNTEANWGAFIPGLICSMEEEYANGGAVEPETISSIKIGLMGPVAGIGDTITQGLIKTVLLSIGVDMTLKGQVAGPLIFLIFFSIYLLGIGVFTFSQGYRLGRNVLSKITDNSIMRKLTDSLSILGMSIAGAMMVNSVQIETSLKIDAGDSEVVIQDLLNSILPGMLSVIAVMTSLYYLRKGVSISKVMLGLFIIAIVGSLIGVF
ncbi:PTS system mannose/fructose/sorbose family transporter subunit IID [Enterococcus faecalis]